MVHRWQQTPEVSTHIGHPLPITPQRWTEWQQAPDMSTHIRSYLPILLSCHRKCFPYLHFLGWDNPPMQTGMPGSAHIGTLLSSLYPLCQSPTVAKSSTRKDGTQRDPQTENGLFHSSANDGLTLRKRGSP